MASTDLKRLYKSGATNVLALLQAGKLSLIRKRLSSVFEQTVVAPNNTDATIRPVPTSFSSGTLRLLPLVCSDALITHHVRGEFDASAILAFDQHPEQFMPYITQEVRNKRPVLFCNDGSVGGTNIHSSDDLRRPSWLRDALPTGLPAGDSFMIVDLDIAVRAVEVGTSLPGQSIQLISIGSIIHSDAVGATAASELSEIANLSEATARSGELKRLLKTTLLTHLQRLRMRHLVDLEARGEPHAAWWRCMVSDVLLPELLSLTALEARLAARCARHLMGRLNNPDTISRIGPLLSECVRRGGDLATAELVSRSQESLLILDREREIGSINEFLDRPSEVLLELSGLQEIGKSAVIEKALAQPGLGPVKTITITPTSSVDFLLSSILSLGPGLLSPPYEDIVATSTSPAFSSALASCNILVIERGDHLLEGRRWREEEFPGLLNALLTSAQARGVKVIFETRYELPLDMERPTAKTRLRVRGLNADMRPIGIMLLDAQLRRVGLSPRDISMVLKERIVDYVGGHPVAIALAANVVYEEGIGEMLRAMKERRGFYFDFLRTIVRSLNISDHERRLLSLLSLARTPVDREVLVGSVDFPATADLHNLIALGAIEVGKGARIEIASVLRHYFDARELDPANMRRFHENAGRSFMKVVQREPRNLAAAVEAEFHGGLAGIRVEVPVKLVDGTLATAKELMRRQKYSEAAALLRPLLERRISREVLRLCAEAEARCGRFDRATDLARQVFAQDPTDTRLLADLARIALTRYQEEAALNLVDVARHAGMEDVSILVVEGRLALRRKDFVRAEGLLQRAVSLASSRNPWPFFFLGRTYMMTGDMEKAIDVLFTGLERFYESDWRNRGAFNAIRTQLAMAYVLTDQLALAGPLVEALLEDDPTPEVAKVFAALIVKRDGVDKATEALEKFEAIAGRRREDRSQLHLLRALFHLGIGNYHAANSEFAQAHDDDRANVFVMMKWAQMLFDLAVARHLENDPIYGAYVEDAKRLVKTILRYDPDNKVGLELLERLWKRFSVRV